MTISAFKIKHCPDCGGRTVAESECRRCDSCGKRWFDVPRCASEVALVDDRSRVLLTVRAIDPFAGLLDLPGGFVEVGESAEEALTREIREELRVESTSLSELRYVTSRTNTYHFEGLNYSVLVLQFAARLQGVAEAGSEISDIVWIEPGQIDAGNLAWPLLHKDLIEACWR